MVVGIVFVALDGGDLHGDDGTRVSVSFLYWVWALVAILFLWGSDDAEAAQQLRARERASVAGDTSQVGRGRTPAWARVRRLLDQPVARASQEDDDRVLESAVPRSRRRSMLWKAQQECPQRDSNPRDHLERVAT
jgi:hypothetical protein